MPWQRVVAFTGRERLSETAALVCLPCRERLPVLEMRDFLSSEGGGLPCFWEERLPFLERSVFVLRERNYGPEKQELPILEENFLSCERGVACPRCEDWSAWVRGRVCPRGVCMSWVQGVVCSGSEGLPVLGARSGLTGCEEWPILGARGCLSWERDL
jgi:hypothetical protein